jgi:hypothetical protein
MGEIAQLKSEGVELDLTRSVEEIHEALARSLGREASFMAGGVIPACDLKWQSDHIINGGRSRSCFRCPLYTADTDDLKSSVCREGRLQEELVNEMRAVLECDSLDAELIHRFESDLEEYAELAEAALA